jgi:hypothetical protein
MDDLEDAGGSTVFSATKRGTVVELGRDPHPDADRYLVIEAPAMLVLFPSTKREREKKGPASEEWAQFAPADMTPPDRDKQLRHAFDVLKGRVSPSVWTSSAQPYTQLAGEFHRLMGQTPVREDVTKYLEANSSVRSAVETLFTSVAMSARADWRIAPASMRGVAARGWFLGRWVPTFLVLDGPILRFLTSQAFRRQQGPPELLRSIRAFFSNRDFMLLRHGFAHWSFSWRTDGTDSEIVVLGQSPSEEVRASRSEADAFHIVTFALVEAIHDVFLADGTTRR